MEHHLSIEESLRFGWAKTRQHSALILQALLTVFGVQIAQEVVMRVLGNTLDGGVAAFILFVASVVLGIGFTLLVLRITQGRHAAYKDLLPPLGVSAAYIGATVLAGIVTLMPLILMLLVCVAAFAVLPNTAALVVAAIAVAAGIVSAMYFALRYALVRFAILDDANMVKSLRTSARLTAGRKWWLFGFVITIGLINVLGAVLLLVGLLVTIPVTLFAFAHVYVQLREHHS